MDISTALARIIGPLLLVVAIGALLNRTHYRQMIAEFLKQPALYYFSGALAFVAGTAIVLYHNIWTADWRVIITLIGWGSLLKGVTRLLFPEAGRRVASSFTEKDWLLTWGVAAVGLVGAALTYYGFAG